MITKKHFNKIAELIERNIPQGKFIIADDLVKDLADFFESDNPNFHRGKFIHACHNPKNKKSAINGGQWVVHEKLKDILKLFIIV